MNIRPASTRRHSRKVGVVATLVAVAAAVVLTVGLWPAGADITADGWHLVGSSHEPAFATNVESQLGVPGGYNPVEYRKDGDVVELRGVAGPTNDGNPMPEPAVSMVDRVSGTTGNAPAGPYGFKIFTLPCGYRPDRLVPLPTESSDAQGKNIVLGGVMILPDGDVYSITSMSPPFDGDGNLILELSTPLDGMRFHADNADAGTCTNEDTDITTTTAS